MFGMLDYRAHKLYWLLTLPLRIIARLVFLCAVAAAPIRVACPGTVRRWYQKVAGSRGGNTIRSCRNFPA
jgi:hypothetical protein